MPQRENGARSEPQPLGVVDARLLRNRADIAADVIRQAILEGRLQPGARLREERLASELGISRTPIREALAVLQSEGIVDAIPQRGAFVRSYDLSEILDLYQTRGVLEAHAAECAAHRLTDEQLQMLWESCERYAKFLEDHDTNGVVTEDHSFHDLIIVAAESRSLARLLEMTACAPIMYRSSYWPQFGKLGLDYHRRIYEALTDRDPQLAQQVMRDHFREAANLLVDNLRGPIEQSQAP